MPDKLILPPVDWDLPELPEEDLSKPNQSFNDDDIVARTKAREAALLQQMRDRFLAEQPRELLSRQEKVEETAAFHSTQQDDAQNRRARLEQQVRVRRRMRRLQRESNDHEAESLNEAEQRVESLFDELVKLSEMPAPSEEQSARFEAQARKIEAQAKHVFQLLVSGGVGLGLLSDPKLTFKRVFERIKKWPARVHPGRHPETEAEFDLFFAWIFEPPANPFVTDDELSVWT